MSQDRGDAMTKNEASGRMQELGYRRKDEEVVDEHSMKDFPKVGDRTGVEVLNDVKKKDEGSYQTLSSTTTDLDPLHIGMEKEVSSEKDLLQLPRHQKRRHRSEITILCHPTSKKSSPIPKAAFELGL
jgi:hypothetical protein